MSPEQIRSTGSVDGRTDIWSLGVSLYELVTGHVPFEEKTVVDMVFAIANKAPMSPLQWTPALPAEFVVALERALQKDVRKRFQTIGEFAIALQDLGGSDVRHMARRIHGATEPSAAKLSTHRRTDGVAAPSTASTVSATETTHASNRASGQTSKKRLALVAGVASALAGLAATGFVVMRTTNVTTKAPPLAALPDASPAPDTRADALVELLVRAEPPSATLRIDDGPVLALPYHARVPRSREAHVLKIEAPGHAAWTKALVYDRDYDLETQLSAETQGASVSSAKPGNPTVGGPKARPKTSR